MRWAIAGFAGLMLAACDSDAGEGAAPLAEHSVDPATGATRMTIPHGNGTATLLAGPEVPVALPDGLTLFPGMRVENNARFARKEGEGALVSFAADAPAPAIIAHYRGEAEAAGFAVTLEHAAAGSVLLIAERSRDGARLAVTATTGTPTTGQLAVSTIPRG